MLTRDAGCRVARFVLVMIAVLLMSSQASAEPIDWKKQWVVDAKAALKLVDGATILDTRGAFAFMRGHLPGAVRVSWKDFSRKEDAERGKLLPRKELQAAIRKAGVQKDRPIIVIGDPPDDWGEDGRIVWMLRAAGHPRAAFVDGGIDALDRAGAKLTMKQVKPSPGDFVVSTLSGLASQDDLRTDGVLLLDTREPREFEGATPYGESRGGHVPGAMNLHFKELLNADGTLLSMAKIRARLKGLGADETTDIIAYCTGGVRSGWLVAVLRTAGFQSVRNYAGSMWEWSAGDPAKHPLETGQ